MAVHSLGTGPVPADGADRVRVYLMRNAARRNETAASTLRAGLGGTADSRDAVVTGG